jgi:hypothetical protein
MWFNGNTSAEKHERVMALLAKMFAMVMEKVLNKVQTISLETE